MNESIQYPRLRWLVLITVVIGYIALSVNMIAFAPLLPEIAKDLKIDIATATNLMTASAFYASVALIVGGFLCDRLGIMFVVILSLLGMGLSSVLIPWIGTSYKAVLWIRIFQGAAGGILFCVMSPICAIWFPERQRGLASGLMGGAVSVGSAIGVLAAPALFLALKSWQQMAAWLSVVSWIGLVLALVIVFSPKPQLPSQVEAGGAPEKTAFKRALTSPITWIGIFVTFFIAWCLQTIYNLTPSYLAADKPIGVGFGPMMSGKLMMAVMIAGIVGPVIAGLLQDKVFRGNPKPVMFIGFILCAFIYTVIFSFVYSNLFLLVVALILAGAGIQFVYPAIVVYVSAAYPIHTVGKMLGLWMGLGMFGGAAGLFAGGFVLARFGNYNVSIMLIALAAVIGFVLALFLPKPKQREAV
jgi:MFS family permease